MIVLLLRMCCVSEAVQGIEDVLEDLDIDIPSPEEIQMLIVGDLSRYSPAGQLLQHHLDINQRVTSSIHENNRRLDITSWIPSHLRKLVASTQCQVGLYVIVIHLKRLVADDLEPMDNGFGTGERI